MRTNALDVDIRRSLSFRARTLELVKGLDTTEARVTGRAANREVRNRNDILFYLLISHRISHISLWKLGNLPVLTEEGAGSEIAIRGKQDQIFEEWMITLLANRQSKYFKQQLLV